MVSAPRLGVRRSDMTRFLGLVLSITMLGSGCFRGGGRLAGAVVEAALITAIVVSATQPPPPRVVYVPPPRMGYVWQPGYWTTQDNQWVWVEGTWIAEQPGYRWAPAHWEQVPDGSWRLVQGQWVPA
jgi:hypothetical protein